MEAAPRLPMLSFELNIPMENVSFGPKIKQYITNFYHEDGESYTTEINNLETLRGGAVRASVDVEGCQLLKRYYCQLHFLKSRFPMEEGQPAAVYFSWKNAYSSVTCKAAEINLELMAILYNIGALHTKLGAEDSRTTHDGMKMACTHFQCAAWAFQSVKEGFPQMINTIMAVEIVHFMQQVCLAQAQECILEKSMMDNRKATIIAKVAVQVVDYYRTALHSIQTGGEEGPFSDVVGSRTTKEWTKYLTFKIAYHKCIALLFQGQQAEELQKMGERVCFYQAACEQLEEARKLYSSKSMSSEVAEALCFVGDIAEGKRKAAKNENEFIYHEEVPEKECLQEVKGASLVKGIPFSVNDPEVSGKDIFSRLVPMEAHEAASLYSEKKAQLLRKMADAIEDKDNKLVEFMSSMQLDILTQMRQASGLNAEIVDRAAELCAKPTAIKELVDAMATLSNSFHEVDSMLNEIQELLQEEEKNEAEYQALLGKRAPSIIATDLAREAAKYKEAHSKASESNQTLHRAMTTHVANLKVLGQPISQLQQQIPSVVLPNKNVDDRALKEVENLVSKVEEMKNQRAMLWTQLRDAVHKDDITGVLITRQPRQSLDDIFQKELEKHQPLINLIEQNTAAQENILSALVDAYANFTPSRRYLQDLVKKRNTTINALISSYDTYDDLLGKANKGIQFYNKLETNVSKLLQRIKSAKNVQDEERQQLLTKNSVSMTSSVADTLPIIAPPAETATPKLKDYLESMKKEGMGSVGANVGQITYPVNITTDKVWPPGIRPAPLGSEITTENPMPASSEQARYDGTSQYNIAATVLTQSYSAANMSYLQNQNESQYSYASRGATTATYGTNLQQTQQYPQQVYEQANQQQQYGQQRNDERSLEDRMAGLMPHQNAATSVPASNHYAQYGYNPQTTPTYTSTNYSYPSISQSYTVVPSSQPIATPPQQQQQQPNFQPTPQQPNFQLTPQQPNFQQTQQQQYYQPEYQQVKEDPTQLGYVAGGTQQQAYMQYPTSSETYDYSGQYTSYTPQSLGPPTVPLTGVNSYSYSTNIFNNTNQGDGTIQPQNNYTNYTYGNESLGYVNQVPTQYQYDYSTYGNQNVVPEAAGYPAPTPISYPTEVPNYSYGVTYPYYSSTCDTNMQTTTTYVQPQVTTATATVPVTSTASSNIDLLAGLDFTISQAPLTPQQPTKIEKPEPEITKTVNPKAEAAPVVKPTVKDEKQVVKRPEVKVLEVPRRNLLEMPDTYKIFTQEVDKYEKFVDLLTKKTLNGPTTLEMKWKEIQDRQDADVQTRIISVARCYPMKNRFPDILPYDQSRVELASTKDDYINASYVKDVTPYTPFFIVTQAPMSNTITDFWVMVREQHVEVIVCLLGDNEMTDVYWPKERGQELSFSNMVISLQSIIVKPNWTERILTVTVPEQRESKIVMHLQFTTWPGSLFPTVPQPFTTFIRETINFHEQQRAINHPMVVHCMSGVGRSGIFCLLMSAMLDLSVNPTSIPDLTGLAVKLSTWRKNILRDREHLKFAYQAFLQHLKDLQAKHGPKKQLADGSSEAAIQEMVPENDAKKDDPLNSLDPFWASKKGI